MSHPVFLTSSQIGHMPIGSENQWLNFYQTADFELQADHFVPILWFMLFKTEDLRWAKYTDLLDVDDTQQQDLLVEYHRDFADHQYAYLVTDQQHALDNLEQNKAFFLETAGAEQQVHFEHFKSLIEQHYPDYILLRSSSLPPEFDSDEHLRFPLQQLEQFQNDPSQDNGLAHYQKVALSQFDDYAYFFYGIDPTTMPHNTHDTVAQETVAQDNVTQDTEQAQPQLKPTENAATAVWICTAIVSILTLAVWFNTHSVLYAFVVFIVSAFILGFISSTIGKSKA